MNGHRLARRAVAPHVARDALVVPVDALLFRFRVERHFPYLRRQSWSFGLDAPHSWPAGRTWSEAQPDILASPNWTLLKEYAGLQGGFMSSRWVSASTSQVSRRRVDRPTPEDLALSERGGTPHRGLLCGWQHPRYS